MFFSALVLKKPCPPRLPSTPEVAVPTSCCSATAGRDKPVHFPARSVPAGPCKVMYSTPPTASSLLTPDTVTETSLHMTEPHRAGPRCKAAAPAISKVVSTPQSGQATVCSIPGTFTLSIPAAGVPRCSRGHQSCVAVLSYIRWSNVSTGAGCTRGEGRHVASTHKHKNNCSRACI